MDGVDHRFKQNQAVGWQADTGANHYAVVAVTGKAAFNRRDRSLVGVDEADLGTPALLYEIGQREFDPSVDPLAVMPGGSAGSEKFTVAITAKKSSVCPDGRRCLPGAGAHPGRQHA